jgi:hypothetical protein
MHYHWLTNLYYDAWLASVRSYAVVRFGVMCWCLCLYVYGGNYGFRNPVLTMWQLMFYLHVSEPLVVLAQESQSPPRYFVVVTGLIFGLWCKLCNFSFTLITRLCYFTILFVTERTVCAYIYMGCFLIGQIYPALHPETTHHLWRGSCVRLGCRNKHSKISDLPVSDVAESLCLVAKYTQQKQY